MRYLLFCLAGSTALAAETAPLLHYAVVETIAGPSTQGLWDYASFDPVRKRVYLAQEGVTLLDLESRRITPRFITVAAGPAPVAVHSVLPLEDGRLLALSDSANDSVRLISVDGERLVAEISLGAVELPAHWRNPDSLLYEPKNNYVIAVNHDSGKLSIISLSDSHLIGSITVGGTLESAVADGNGKVYVNVESKNALVAVDPVRRKVLRDVALPGCEEPTGITYDTAERWIISVCSNGILEVVSATDFRVLAQVHVARGADCVMYDRRRHVALVPSGDAGTLTIVAIGPGEPAKVRQIVKTRRGTRVGTLDQRTGRVYLPTGDFGLPAAPVSLPGIGVVPGLRPGTFTFLVVGPQIAAGADSG